MVGDPLPHALDFPITKDPQICDPDAKKTTDLERLIVGPQGGVANTVVYLKNISSGKAHGPAGTAAPSGPEALPLHSAHSAGSGEWHSR